MKTLTFILCLIVLNACMNQNSDKSNKVSSLVISNMASNHFGGRKEIVIKNKSDISFIKDELKKLSNDKSDSIQINVNNGFLEINKVYKETKVPFFSVIFTKYNGNVIRYKGKHYYYNEDLVSFLKGKLGIDYVQ